MRNRKQRPGETIEEYAAAIYELWKRIDPMSRRTELDRIHEFIEGLRPEFIIPVQSAMPASVADAVEKARAVETAFSIGMDLSAYSMLPGYINNMHGAPVPAKANMALYQSAYTAPQLDEVALEQKITKGIQEGILAAFAQQQRMGRPQNNFNNRQNRPDDRKCYKCNRSRHLARDCRQRPEQNQESRECYVCGKRGHLARDCYQRNNRQSQNNQYNQNNRFNQNNQGQRRNN